MRTANGDLRVITLNINWDNNLQRVLPFLASRAADVVCLQEVREDTLSVIAEAAGGYHFYVPMCGGRAYGAPGMVGIAIFSRRPLSRTKAHYYVGAADEIVELDNESFESRRTTTHRALAIGEVRENGVAYRIATTHFSWTPDGKADEYQRRDLRKMLDALQQEGECILSGDFNAPRGGEIYETLSHHFKDNVPIHYDTSLDPELHRAKGLKLMVDALFTTPRYAVSDVTMHFGVSDHAALEAVVSHA